MPVIALTQGMGSLAQDVAELLAKELNLTTLQHEVAERVADRMHVSKSLISRMRSGKAGPIERFTTDREAIALYTQEELLDAAAKGNVVLRGWGATALLRSVPHVPCIRIIRPFEKRVQWLMEQLETDDRSAAESEIHRSDHANASRMHEQFGVNWGDPVLFDMVLNTDRMSVQTCVDQIKQLLTRPEFTETPESVAMLKGLALSAHIRSAMRSDPETRDITIGIDSLNGQVALTGIVTNAAERDAVERVVRSVPGVTSVDDRLNTMGTTRRFPSVR